MAKIARKNQKIFGSTAGVNQISEFGSLAAGSIVYTTDPETIQSLGNYLSGWYAGVLGGNSPAIQDMNALCYLYAYQLAYLFQAGIPEWNSLTTYYIGSFASNGTGVVYRSITDTNLNNALTDTTKWLPIIGSASDETINPGVTPTKVLTANDNGKTFLVNSANAAMQFTLPAGTTNFTFTIKDIGNFAATNNITVVRAAAENIEGLAASFVCRVSAGFWKFNCANPDWWLV